MTRDWLSVHAQAPPESGHGVIVKPACGVRMRRAIPLLMVCAFCVLGCASVRAASPYWGESPLISKERLFDIVNERARVQCTRALDAKDEKEALAIEFALQIEYGKMVNAEKLLRSIWQMKKQDAESSRTREFLIEVELAADLGRRELLQARLVEARMHRLQAEDHADIARRDYATGLAILMARAQVQKHAELCLRERRAELQKGVPAAPTAVVAGESMSKPPVADSSGLSKICGRGNAFGCTGAFAGLYTSQCYGRRSDHGTGIISFAPDDSFELRLRSSAGPAQSPADVRGRIGQSGHAPIVEIGSTLQSAGLNFYFRLERGSDGSMQPAGGGRYRTRIDRDAMGPAGSCDIEFTLSRR
jgi:hypothetical protein